MGCPSQFHKFSVFLCYSMGFQKVAYGSSMRFQWDVKVFSLDSYRISTGFFGISMIFLSSSDDISLNLFSDFRKIPMGIDKDFYGLFMVFPWDSHGISIGLS